MADSLSLFGPAEFQEETPLEAVSPNMSMQFDPEADIKDIVPAVQGNLDQLGSNDVSALSADAAPNPLINSRELTHGMDPVRTSKVLALSRESGLPPRVVEQHVDEMERRRTIPDEKLDLIQNQYPQTAQLLSDPDFFVVAQDDIDRLTALEGTIRQYNPGVWERIGTKWEESRQQLEDGVRGFALGALSSYVQLADEEEAGGFVPNAGVKALRELARGALAHVQAKHDIEKAKRTAPLLPAENNLQQYVEDFVGASAPILATMAITALTRSPYAGAAFMGTQIAGGDYLSRKEQGASDVAAFGSGLADAALQAPLEALSLGKFFNIFKATGGAQILKTVATALGTEFTTEFLQKFPEDLTEDLALMDVRGQDVWDALGGFLDNLDETAKAGLYEGLLSAPWALLGGAGQVVRDYSNLRATEQEQTILDSLTQDIAQTNLAQLDPVLHQQALQILASGSQIENVFIDSQAFEAVYGQDVAGQTQVLNSLGISQEAYQNAVATGEELTVQFGNYASTVAAFPEFANNLANDRKLSKQGLTRNEWMQTQQELAKTYQDILIQSQEEVQAATQEDAETKAIYEQVYAARQAAGRVPDAARLDAAQFTAALVSMAKMSEGKYTATQLFEAYMPQVRAGQTGVDQQADTTPLMQDPVASIGININDSTQPFTEQILTGEKTIETRNSDSLRPYVGRRVGIVRTGLGQAQLVGYATVGEPKVYTSEEEFRADEAAHRVAAGSAFDFKGRKYGYPMLDVERVDPRPLASRGIIARSLQQDAAYAGVENEAEVEEAARLWAEKGTESPYFKRWSGGAPVVLKNAAPSFVTGQAIVVEADHGSPDIRFVQEDGVFKSEKERYGFGRGEAAFWFSRDTATAKTYADPRRAFDYQNAEPGIVSAFVRLDNPLVVDASGQNWRDAQKRGKTSDVIKEARENGHDGVIIYNVKDDYNNSKNTRSTTTLTVFSSNQIKSTGNRGTFDPADARILNQDVQQFVADAAAKVAPGAEQGLVKDVETGETVFNVEEAARGLASGMTLYQGVTEPIGGRFLRGTAKTTGRADDVVTQALSESGLNFYEFDQFKSIEEAKAWSDKVQWLDPVLDRRKKTLRYKKPNDLGWYGNEKMAFPNAAYSKGRNTYDVPGCGRAAWAIYNDQELRTACYGGACYAEAIKVGNQGLQAGITKGVDKKAVAKRIERGALFKIMHERGLDALIEEANKQDVEVNRIVAVKKDRELVQALYEQGGNEAVWKEKPNFIVENGMVFKITLGRFFTAAGRMLTLDELATFAGSPAVVSTKLASAKGQDIRLGVDTDGAAWLTRTDVMDALLAADMRSLTVYSSAYHKPPQPHPLSGRTIINVTVSGWHPIGETLSRLRWAEEARANGWNVILREVLADPAVFEQDKADVYNRVHEALLKTDFFIMQQPLHIGKKTGGELWGLPGCCKGSLQNPGTCDQCEVAEGLGKRFQEYWDIAEEDRREEKILPDVEDYRGRQMGEKTFYQQQSPLGFVSAVETAVNGMDFKTMPGKDLANRVKKTAGIKAEELEDLGLIEWLEGAGKVTKDQVLEFVRNGGPQIEEVVKDSSYDQTDEEAARDTFEEEFHCNNEGWASYMYESYVDAIDIAWSDPGHFVWERLGSKEEYLEANEGDEEDAFSAFSDAVRMLDFDEVFTPEELEDIKDSAWDQYKDDYIAAERDRRDEESRDSDNVGNTKFGQYTMPGGENYREVLMTLPDASNRESARKDAIAAELESMEMTPETQARREELRAEYRDLSDAILARGSYQSSHWDEPNVLAHFRLNDRTGPNGEKILFIEEIQSDWHQEGRKKGYKTGEPIKFQSMFDVRAAGYQIRSSGNSMNPNVLFKDGERVGLPFRSDAEGIRNAEFHANEGYFSSVPDTPFKKSWALLAFKRVLRMAAEQGYDSVAWTPGEVQAERYDLSKQVESIGYQRRGDLFNVTVWDKRDRQIYSNQSATADELENVVGKEIAQKMVDGVGRPEGQVTYLEDLDLKVGGEGMKGFYDKILPAEVNKYAKKWGVKAAPGTVSGQQVWTLPITDQMRQDILQGQPLYQQQSEPQASFTFKTKSGKPLIELFRTANQSSFLHETGHLYLEMVRELALQENAPAPVTALWAQTKTALKIDDGPISREAHEEWARNLEAYFLEGAAPSLGLRKIFAQYAQWLRSIYKQVEQIFLQSGTQFNEDLKPIFDRIFASEKDIEEARSFYSSQKPFFAAADPKVMAKEREKYEERRLRARESMEDKRLRQLTEAWVKASGGKAKIKAEVTEEVKARPVMAVIKGAAGGMNMAALDASVGEDLRKQLKAVGRYSSLVKKEGTVDPDILAAENGYESAAAMVEDLISFPGEKAAITAGVEARMEAERQRISRGLAETDLAADEAYHNDDQLAVLAAEFEILSQQAAQKTKRLEASMVRDVAKQLLTSEKVDFATQSSRFARLERRAAKLARAAYERGDAKAAADYKRQEMLNHAMFIESVDLKRKIGKTAARIKRGVMKTKGISPEVKTLLQGLGIQYGILPYKKERDPVRAFEMWNQDLVAKGGKIPTLEGWVEEMRKLGISAPLDPFLNNAAAVPYQQITVGQFRALEEGVRILRRVDRGLHTVTWIDGSTITMEDAIERLQAHVAGRGGKAPDPLTYDPNAVTLAARNFFAEHTKTSTIIQALDNWEAGGLFYQLIYRPVMDADSDLSARWATEAPKIKALFEPIRRQLRKKVVVLGKARPRAQLVAAALNVGNQGNRERLIAGLGINEAQLDQLLAPLTTEEMDFVQAVWDYIATFKDEAFAVERRLTGREPAAVDPVPFEFKGKTYAGGYYPVSYDKNLRDQKGEARDAKEALDELFGGTPAGTAMTAHGHLEARASAGTGERLSQELSVISDHVTQVLRDITHREAVVNVAKLLKNKQIMAMITDVVGREKAKQLWPWLVSVSKEGREQIQLTAVEKMLLHFRPAMTFYTQAYKVGTALMQAAGFLQVFEFVQAKHVGQAVWQLYGKGLLSLNMFSDGEIISHPLIKEIREKSPQMNERLLNADRDIRDATKEFSTSESALTAYKKHGFKATVAMQFYVADVVAWQGAYLQALTDGMTEKDAINRADFVVEQAMGAGYTRALSKIQRGGSIQRFLTMFYTFGNVLYNLAARRAGVTKKQLASGQYGAAVLGASSFLALQWVMPVLFETLVRGDMVDDDDDETIAEKLLVNLLTYPAQSVLIARELSGIAKGFKYRFSPALKPFESVGQWISSVARAIEQEDASIAAKPTAQLIGTTTGLIPAQFINSGEVLTDYLTGEDQELSVKELLYGKGGRK